MSFFFILRTMVAATSTAPQLLQGGESTAVKITIQYKVNQNVYHLMIVSGPV